MKELSESIIIVSNLQINDVISTSFLNGMEQTIESGIVSEGSADFGNDDNYDVDDY